MIEPTQEQRPEREPDDFIVISKSEYEKLLSLLDDNTSQMYSMLADLDPEDWEDPSVYEGKP